jgi:hypothetical protein
MTRTTMEIDEVRVSLAGGADDARARRIARLTVAYARSLLDDAPPARGARGEIGRVDVPPVHVSFETMDDETIARRSAAAIHRALRRALAP